MQQNDLRSQSLDLLRFPLAIVVLIIHVFSSGGITIHGQTYNMDSYPVFIAVNHFIDGFLRQQSVPIYFFISGFVFFLGVNFKKNVYVQKLKNRVHTLLIPYVIWNTLAVLLYLSYFLPCFSSLFPNIHHVKLDFSLSAILQECWNAADGILTIRPHSPNPGF